MKRTTPLFILVFFTCFHLKAQKALVDWSEVDKQSAWGPYLSHITKGHGDEIITLQLKGSGLLILAMLFFTVFQSNGQQSKPADSGYVPVNGIKIYYEVYGEGKPIVLLHGAFYTIEMNWGQLIPELSKTRKVIAVELQGHGHTPFSDRKLDFATLASDVEGGKKISDHFFYL